MTTLEQARKLDKSDTLAPLRERFSLPEDVVYLDGNSLGALPRAVPARLSRAIEDHWGRDLIQSWVKADWVNLQRRVGNKIAPLIGAAPDTVVATDSTSVNLFKVLSAALSLQPDRKKIISERRNFPTDLYIAQGVIGQLGPSYSLGLIEDVSELEDTLDDDTAVLMLTHVNFRTGAMHDMARLTDLAHQRGVLCIWDLSHSAGAVPVNVTVTSTDFAVGCGYKYLNGGPGAPAYVYVAPDHQAAATQPLSGWFSHADVFAFSPDYQPAPDIGRYLCGTQPVLSLLALDEAINVWADVSMASVHEKSMALTEFFIACVEAHCSDHGLTLITPRDPDQRGSQVSWSMRGDARAVMQAMIERDVIGDYRPPDILRFGFTPLYTRFADVWRAADTLAHILATRKA